MGALTERPQQVRLMGDYGVRYPLWDAWGQMSEDASALQCLLGADAELLASLAAWQDHWEARRNPADDKWLEAEGARLLDSLRAAAPDITFEFIPPKFG